MKSSFLFKALILAAGVGLTSGATAAQPTVPNPLNNLAGCYKVSYRFVEDGAHDTTIVGDFIEYVSFQTTEVGGLLFQHYGQQGTEVIRHWGETWTVANDGSVKQLVVGPTGRARYECSGQFQFNQFRCFVKDAPKPIRDTDRKDYVTLDRDITLQITSKGWVQAQNDVKKDAAGKAVSNEVGWNQYERVDEKVCAPSIEFAKQDN